MKMRSLGLGKAKKVEPLTEEAAVELGSSIISEMFLFSVAAGTITWEYLRQARKDTTREEGQLADIDELQKQVEDLGLNFEKQDAQLREIYRLVIAEPWRTQQSQQVSGKTQSTKGATQSVDLSELKKKIDQIGLDLQKQNAQIREMQKSMQSKSKP